VPHLAVDAASLVNILSGLLSVDCTLHYGCSRFEVFTAVKIELELSCVVTPCNVAVGYHPENGG
jgi:hypothetical protein